MAGRSKAEMYISVKLNILIGMNNIALKRVFFYSVSRILFPALSGRNRLYWNRLYWDRLYWDRRYWNRRYWNQLYWDRLYLDLLYSDRLYMDLLYSDRLYL